MCEKKIIVAGRAWSMGEHQQETTPVLIREMYPICHSNIMQDADDVPCTCKSSYHCSINTHALQSYSKTT